MRLHIEVCLYHEKKEQPFSETQKTTIQENMCMSLKNMTEAKSS